MGYHNLKTSKTKRGSGAAVKRLVKDSSGLLNPDFLHLAEQSPNMIFVNHKGRVVYANSLCSRIMGYSRQEFYSPKFDFMCLIAPESRNLIRKMFRQHMKGREVDTVEYGLVAENGMIMDAVISTRLIDYGADKAILGIVTDISHYKKIEKDLRRERDLMVKYLNLAGVINVVLDAKGRIVMMNRKGCEILGYKEKEVIGQDWFGKFIPRALRGDVRKVYFGLMAGTVENVGRYQNEVLTRKGETRIIEWSNTVLCNDAGKITGTMSSGLDVTDEKSMEIALRESEARYRDLFVNAPVGIYRTSPDGKVMMANSALLKMLKYRSFEALSKIDLQKDKTQFPETPRQVFLQQIEKAGYVHGFETKWKTADGDSLSVRENARVVRDKAGRTLYYEGTVEDLTERKRTADELKYRVNFDQLITNIASRFVNLAPADLDKGINDALKRLGEFMGVDRSYVFVGAKNRDLASNTHEWVADGIEPLIGKLQNMSASAFPWITARITGQEIIHVPRVADLPAEAGEERKLFGLQKVHSFLILPLISGASVVGFVGFDSVRKEMSWSPEVISLLRIVSEIFASAIERCRVSSELESQIHLISALLDNVPDHIYFKDLQSRFIRVNKALALLFKQDDPAKVIGKTDMDFFDKKHADEAYADEQKVIKTGKPLVGLDEKTRLLDGTEVWVSTTKMPLRDEKGQIIGTFGISRDVTEKKLREEENRKIQERMQRSQKLESLGVLSGCIAHDFNNLLMGILGNTSLALLELQPESPARESVKQIETVALRAAELTNQMLAYSGKSKSVVKLLNLANLVRDMAHLLEVSISKKIKLIYDFTTKIPLVEGDPVQIRQVVMNLIINATEAIGDKYGTITLSIREQDCDRYYLASCYVSEEQQEGKYLCLSVSDTGCGMSAETRSKIFDPFFTTKIAGRGLGLAAVLGIVRAHKGAVKLYSEVGKGTNFEILFPCSDKEDRTYTPLVKAENGKWSGSGTVLVVDDDEIILSVSEQMLRKAGFTALKASDARLAVQLYRENLESIVAIILDVALIGTSAVHVLASLRSIKQNVPILMTSGFSESSATEGISPGSYQGFLQKPFNTEALLGKLQQLLTKKPYDAGQGAKT